MIKVLIVEDSRVVSEYMYYVLSKDPEIQVIGNVSNGADAIKFLEREKPDIITMDIDMPIMDGLEATRRIMSTTPVPIIIVTASRNARELKITMEALAAGALSVIEKSVGIGHPDEQKKAEQLVTMVKTMAGVKLVTRQYRISKEPEIQPLPEKTKPTSVDFRQTKIVAVGVSSGGPPVINKIFSEITGKFPFPIIVVQHITEGFLEGLVDWLSRMTLIPIHIATHDDTVLPGHIYFAPDNYHMAVTRQRKIKLSRNLNKEKICPSAAHLFESIYQEYGRQSLAIILTGMGRDGAQELKMLRDAGAVTIAQDRESSLVYGMPGEAVKLNAAVYVLNPEEISGVLHMIENMSYSENQNEQ